MGQPEGTLAVFRIQLAASSILALPQFLGVFAQGIVGTTTIKLHGTNIPHPRGLSSGTFYT